MTQRQDVKSTVRDYILKEFLPGESPDALQDSTELITRGILDSLATLKLVSCIEERFNIALEPHETDADYLNTIDSIAALVESKTKR
jgi:acyl carrier protein